jgi:hypothetical protein
VSRALSNRTLAGAFWLALGSAGFVPACSGQTGGDGSGGSSVASGGAAAGSGGTGGSTAPTGGSASGGVDAVSYVKASNTGAGDLFGVSAAFSADGSTLALGASREASGMPGAPADESATDAGAVYVFSRSGTSWEQGVPPRARRRIRHGGGPIGGRQYAGGGGSLRG